MTERRPAWVAAAYMVLGAASALLVLAGVVAVGWVLGVRWI